MSHVRKSHTPATALKCALVAALIGLVACSDGVRNISRASGSANSQPSQSTSLVGVFGAIPVAGVSYRSASHSGVTNAAGEFTYRAGENIEFLLGEMVLGSAPGAPRVDEFAIARLMEPPQNQAQFIDYFAFRSLRSPLTKAANVAGVLQSLDTNQDFSDGIQILPAVAALFAPDQIDLYQPYWQFRNDRRMRKLLYRATKHAELTPRALRTGSLALQYLLDFSIEQYQRFERDDLNDGIVDFVAEREYNVAGKLIGSSTDADGDGVFESGGTQTYDSYNIHIGTQTDTDGDGVADHGWAQTLNEFGSQVRRENHDPIGVVVRWRDQRWDDEGALVYRETSSATSHTVERWNFVNGLFVDYEKDQDADGTVDELVYVDEVDLNTDVTESRVDTNADGVVDQAFTYERNAVGQPLRIVQDVGADGSADKITEHDYNEFGELLETREWDDDGNLIRRYTWQFGSDGIRLGRSIDSDGDGAANSITTYVDAGSMSHREVRYDFDADGIDDDLTFYTLNRDGQVLLTESDSDADGMIDSRTENFYEGFRLIRSERDSNNDGVVDQVERFSDWVRLPITHYL